MSKKKSTNSKKQVHFFLNKQTFNEWEKFRIKHGIPNTSDFIIRCVNDVVFPLPSGNQPDKLQTEIFSLKNILKSMETELQNLLIEKDKIIRDQGKMNIPDLEKKIIEYLKKNGPTNEYIIASDLNEETPLVYQILADLVNQGKVYQVIKQNNLEWKLHEW